MTTHTQPVRGGVVGYFAQNADPCLHRGSDHVLHGVIAAVVLISGYSLARSLWLPPATSLPPSHSRAFSLSLFIGIAPHDHMQAAYLL